MIENQGPSKKAEPPLPTLFLGHGSPMNLVADNQYTSLFKRLGQELGLESPPNLLSRNPSSTTVHPVTAILVISAHWLTNGTKVLAAKKPKQIYDFYGFPSELYDIKYEPPGAQDLASQISKLNPEITLAEDWGIDHGSWSLLHHLHPSQRTSLLQLSIDKNLSPAGHLKLARQLKGLRNMGVLTIGSGNLVHNLKEITLASEGPHKDWALEFENVTLESLTSDLSSEEKIEKIFTHKLIDRAHPTKEHLIPLIYALGMGEDSGPPNILIKGLQNATISMASLRWG